MLPVRISSACRLCFEAAFLSSSQPHQWKANTKIYSKKTCCSHEPARKCGKPAEEGCAIFQWGPEGSVERGKTKRNEPRQDAGIIHEIVCKTYPVDPLREARIRIMAKVHPARVGHPRSLLADALGVFASLSDIGSALVGYNLS